MDISSFLFGLLGKRQRRICILTRWLSGSEPCVGGENVQSVFKNLFDCLLYAPIHFALFKDHCRVFNVVGMRIYYSWLTKDELAFIGQCFLNRWELFPKRQFSATSDDFFLMGMQSVIFPMEQRRELVRDVVLLTLTKKDMWYAREMLLYVVQQMLLHQWSDRFVYELHNALQGRFPMEQIMCYYP